MEYPYSDGRRTKFRPALVLSSQNDGDILFARITSKAAVDPFDLSLVDWQEAGLMAPSTVKLEKLSSLLASRVKASIGQLSTRDKQQIVQSLHNFIDSFQ